MAYLEIASSFRDSITILLLIGHNGVKGGKEIFTFHHHFRVQIFRGIFKHITNLHPFLVADGEAQLITCLKQEVKCLFPSSEMKNLEDFFSI